MTGKFQPYPEYTSSGLEWLGEIPSHWKVKKLKYVGEAIIGLTYSPDDVVDENEGTLVLRSSNVQNRKLAFKDNVYVSKEIPPKLRTRKGDMLICARNGSRALIGKNAIIDENAEGASFGAFMSIFRSLDNNFLSKVFNSSLFDFQAGTFLTSTINQLTTGNLNSFEVPYPPREERNTIAAFLDYETARIDRLIERQQRLIELLKEKRQAVISHAVTKGLNPDAPMKDSGVEWLGVVPAHWDVTRMKYRIKSMDQGWSPQCEARLTEEGEFGVLKVGAVNGGVFKPEQHKALPAELSPRTEYRLKKDQLLISRANTRELVGSAAVVPGDFDYLLLCDKLYRLSLSEDTDPRFIALVLGISAYREQIELEATGASDSMQNIGQATIRELPIALPPLAEAKNTVEAVERKLSELQALSAKLATRSSILMERRTALISATVTGKIDVRSWRPKAQEEAELDLPMVAETHAKYQANQESS